MYGRKAEMVHHHHESLPHWKLYLTKVISNSLLLGTYVVKPLNSPVT